MTNLLGRTVTLLADTTAQIRYEIVAVDSHESWTSSPQVVPGWTTSYGAVGYRTYSFLLKASDGSLFVANATGCKIVD